jgi:hypothetical protein
MASIVVAGDTSGTVTLAAPSTAGTTTLTLPTTSGTVLTTGSTFAGTGPAFRAIASASQTLTSNTWTKVTLGTEAWDTNNNFNTSTYRFTPTVAGYYQINGGYSFGPTASAGYTLIASIYRNGSEVIRGAEMYSLTGTFNQSVVSGVLYMNGSTDYIELYVIVIGGSVSTGDTTLCFMDATLVRSA